MIKFKSVEMKREGYSTAKKHKQIFVSLALLLFFVFIAAFAPYLAKYDPVEARLSEAEQPPSVTHPFGTDYLGRDVFSRVVYGARVSLLVGVIAAVVAVWIGTSIGLIAGYYGGYLDNILMRIVDTVYSLPALILLIIIMSMFERSIESIVIAIGLTHWMSTARLIRSEALSLKNRPFVEATVALGARESYIMLRHIFPNIIYIAIVSVTLMTAHSILTESMLSFLGLGIPPHESSWGNMLTDAQRDIMFGIWWTTFFPGLMIVLTVLSITFLGDGLRDILDPRRESMVRL
ncbi:MAG: ABC transporter permease [Methanophagales archaeon]|nr:ABC transporter permease [Methanophagales archaeon]